MSADVPQSRYRVETGFEPACLEVELAAIGDNVRSLRAEVGADCALYAALKANAYGFGLVPAARELERAGVDAISVARMQDAIELRVGGIELPILLYAGAVATPELVEASERFRITPTVLDVESAKLFSDHLSGEWPVFVKLDVGLRRLGLEPAELPAFAKFVSNLPNLRLDGIYAHLHVPADPVPAGYLEHQFELFCNGIAEVEQLGIAVRVKMAASSSVLRLSNTMNFNAIDPGRLYFGLVPGGHRFEALPLRSPLKAFRSKLLYVKELQLPTLPPPSFAWAHPGMRLGVAALGAADGLDAAAGNHVLVRGQRLPIVGPPSLEHLRIDLSDCPDAVAGDDIVIIGRQGDEEITVDEVASARNLSLAALVSIGVRESVPRRYVG